MTKPVVAKSGPYEETLEANNSYAWCSCGLSTNQPFCDGSHKQTDDLKPIIFELDNDGTVFLCGCKRTNNSPYCDGTHNTL